MSSACEEWLGVHDVSLGIGKNAYTDTSTMLISARVRINAAAEFPELPSALCVCVV